MFEKRKLSKRMKHARSYRAEDYPQKAVATIKARYGEDFFKDIGRRGGSAPSTSPKGFAANRKLASIVGRKGGTISRRRPSKEAL